MTTTRTDLRTRIAQLLRDHDRDQDSTEALADLIVGITTGTGCQATTWHGEHEFDDRADAGTYEVCGKPINHRDHGIGLPVHTWGVSIDTLVREGLRPGDKYVDDDYDEVQVFDPRRFWVGGEIPSVLLLGALPPLGAAERGRLAQIHEALDAGIAPSDVSTNL